MEDNIDFSLILNKHGWSTCLVSIKGTVHEIGISSVPSHPLHDVANLLLALLNNETAMEMKWFDEPGWSIFKITRDDIQRHIISVEIGSAEDQNGNQYEKMVNFSIKQKQFLIILFYQLKKNCHLLTEKSFMKGREYEFPYKVYNKLIERITTTCPEIL